MTTKTRTAIVEEPYVPAAPDSDEELDRAKAIFEDLPLERLYDKWSEIDNELKFLRTSKGMLALELMRRVEQEHPDRNEEQPGIVDVAGEHVVLRQSWDRDYTYFDEVISELLGAKLLSQDELDELIPKWEAKVSGRAVTKFQRRGGKVAEILSRIRISRVTPKFEWIKR